MSKESPRANDTSSTPADPRVRLPREEELLKRLEEWEAADLESFAEYVCDPAFAASVLDDLKDCCVALRAHQAEREQLTHDLAECYRWSGADPDDNEDWRLARYAVLEVKRLREESDAENASLSTRLAASEAARASLLTVLKALTDRVDATSECDHKRISCEDIGCIGGEVRRARVAIAKSEGH